MGNEAIFEYCASTECFEGILTENQKLCFGNLTYEHNMYL